MKRTLFIVFMFASGITRGQVNLQTGSATFSLPMFNWQDNKSRLNAAVAINYNSGNGLKVNDVATNIGQGWSLVAGGVITRMQVGEPDDQKARNGAVEDISKYPAGYLYNTVSADSGCPKALANYPIFKDQNHVYKQNNPVAADRELDYFSFQFNGRTGIFVLSKTSDVGVSVGDSRIKISFSRTDMDSTRTTISAFTIQDENGLIYRFKDYYGKTKVLKNNYCDANLVQELSQPQFNSENIYHESSFDDPAIINPYIINSWFLAEIEDPLTHRKITFAYNSPLVINAALGVDIAYYANKNYAILSHKTSKLKLPSIASVTYPDGHQVTFNYGQYRVDVNGDKVLASVDVKYNDRYISRYQLNSTYVMLNRYGVPVSDFQKKVARLYLKSVVQYSADLKGYHEPYIFDYYLGSNTADDMVPPPFSYAKDVWGFYNGDSSRSTDGSAIGDLVKPLWEHSMPEIRGLVYLRNSTGAVVTLNPKSGYAKNGLLKQIRYPTGGSLSYDYEQNTGVIESYSGRVGGVHVSKTRLVDGGYINDCDHPLETSYTYLAGGGSTSSLWGLEMPENKMVVNNHYAAENKYYYYKIPLGSCTYRYKYPGIISREQRIDLTDNQKWMEGFSEGMDWISQITTVIDAITYAANGGGPATAVIMDMIGGLIEVVLTCFSSNKTINNSSDIYYNMDLNSSNPLPAQFSRVEMVQGNGDNGKTVFEFTKDSDYALWASTNSMYSMRQRFAYWAYGLPRLTTWYDANGDKVKETENVYDYTNAKHAFADLGYAYPSSKCVVKENYSKRNTDWEDASSYDPATTFIKTSNDDIDVDLYDIFSGRTELKDTYERIYKQGTTGFAEIATRYDYHTYGASNDNLLPYQVLTRQSNGVKNLKKMTYSADYSSGILATLNTNNILSEPVSASTYVYDSTEVLTYNRIPRMKTLHQQNEQLLLTPDGDADNDKNAPLSDDTEEEAWKEDDKAAPVGWKILNETVTEFTALTNGSIKPYRTLVQRFGQPAVSYTLYVAPGSSSNPSYKEVQTFSYNSQSNLTGMFDEGGHMVTNIYGYDDKYVIASVINAEPVTDKPAYSSFETNEFGGWALTGTAAYTTANAVTGARSFSLSGANSLAAAINTGKAYKVSFWSTASVSVSGSASLVKSAPVIGGFTYYEYDVPQGAGSVSISGTATLDELRIYPANARMRTVTYDPVIGKTSETDENNRSAYYEYDDLARVRFIKDDQRNMVKMYEYNTTKKAGGCIETYTNFLVKEVFTRNNCGSGYIGAPYEYTIAANTYTSAVSQEEVDALVQQELDTYAQAAANSSASCILLYYNAAQSESFIPETCEPGTVSAAVSYSVAAGKYYTTVSQVAADKMALDEIRSNGQSYANGHASCTTDNTPVWEADYPASVRCEMSGSSQTGYQEVYCHDVNPNNTVTYQWKRIAQDLTACPVTTAVVASNHIAAIDFTITFTNLATSAIYTYTIYGNYSNRVLATLPPGQYDVSIAPLSGPSVFYFYDVDGSYQYDIGTVTFNNITVSPGVDLPVYISF